MGNSNIIRASQTGAVMDCDLMTGLSLTGGTATDNTAVLNGVLVNASPIASVKLLLDGVSMVNTSLVIPGGNVTIEGNGWDSGIMEIPGSTAGNFPHAPIVAGPNTFTPPSSNFTNVTLRDFKVDGNEAHNPTVQRTNIWFAYVDGILLDQVWSHAPRYFNAVFTTCNYINVVNSRFESSDTTIPNTDGIHVNGGCSNIHISGCHFRTNDDAIALNAPEGYAGGNISNVTIDNCTFDNCTSLMRAYGYGQNYAGQTVNPIVSNVVVSNCSGSVENAVFLLGNDLVGAKAIDTVRDLAASNISFGSLNNYILIIDPVGKVSFENCTWLAPSVSNPVIAFYVNNIPVSDLSLVNFRIYRTTAGNGPVYGVGATGTTGCSIKKLTESGRRTALLRHFIDMHNLTITELVIDALDTMNIAALVNPTTGFTGIGSIRGAGVLQTGFNIPDSVMANGSPYLSATSPNVGKPCIKLGGVVYPFTI